MMLNFRSYIKLSLGSLTPRLPGLYNFSKEDWTLEVRPSLLIKYGHYDTTEVKSSKGENPYCTYRWDETSYELYINATQDTFYMTTKGL
jgi:hypothetical protein